MPTYFVRASMGNDGNTGLSPAQAWLTIDHAAGQVAAGDTVHVGAGVYREQVTMVTSGASGNQISYIADIDGSQTGDAGLVIISAYDSPIARNVRNRSLFLNKQTFFTWRGFVFIGGRYSTINDDAAGNTAWEGVIIEDCTIIGGESNVSWRQYAFWADVDVGVTPLGDGLIVRRCCFLNGMKIDSLRNESGHINLKIRIENCVFFCNTFNGIQLASSLSGTYSPGGMNVNNCTFMGSNTAVHAYYLVNTTNPIQVRNCVMLGMQYPVQRSGGAGGVIDGDHNSYSGKAGGAVGANDRNGGEFALLGAFADFPFRRVFGWSPVQPFEPLVWGSYESGPVDDASATFAPADDLYGNARPQLRNVDDRGAVEARARPEKETTTTYDSSPASARFEGAGYHDAIVPVSADLTTVKVQARYDANYTGSLPVLEVLNISGVADQSDAMVAAANTWEQLSCAFTPASAGFVRVRLRSQDTSANGECFFDALEVS